MHIIVKFIILYHQNDKFYFFFFLIGVIILERFMYRTRSNVLAQSFLLYDLLVLTFFWSLATFIWIFVQKGREAGRVFLSLVFKYELINCYYPCELLMAVIS